MPYNKEVFGSQYYLVAEFVRHLAYYRGLYSELQCQGVKSMFWSQTTDSHLEVAILMWCKVFGSTGPNRTHWQRIAIKDAEVANNKFRKKLYQATGMTHAEWKRYHKQMCDFRDKYVAHFDIGDTPVTPQFDKALAVVFAYDDWVRDLIRPDVMEDVLLKVLYERWLKVGAQIGSHSIKYNEQVLKL